jgi:hypothetical protein
LFIDSSKVSLKVVLLHNENKFPSVPSAHAAKMRGSYGNNYFWRRSSMKNTTGTFVGI